MKKCLLGVIVMLVLTATACGNNQSEKAQEVLNNTSKEVKNDNNIRVKVTTDIFINECEYIDGVTYSKVTKGNVVEEYKEDTKPYEMKDGVWVEGEYSKYLDAVCNLELLFNATDLSYKENKENITINGKIEAKYLQMAYPEKVDGTYKITYTYTLDNKLVSISVDKLFTFEYSFND